ncbi:MAG: amidohydrolase family protein, partial [Gemmatimonadota bacterium]
MSDDNGIDGGIARTTRGRTARGAAVALASVLLVGGTIAATTVGRNSPEPERDAPTGDRGDAADACRDTLPMPAADHHMHVWNEEGRDALVRLLGELRAGEPPAIPTFDGDQVAARLDSAGIDRGVLLSNAYLYGSPDVRFDDEYGQVRAQNDWVAGEAARHPDRLVAFFGVNPLADYAGTEVERCAEVSACLGIKLHFANSDVDLHDPEHVRRLRSVFARADARGLAIAVHLRTRREEFGEMEVEIFIDRVASAAPHVPIQVAHMGGSSGFDAATQRLFMAFAAQLEAHPERTRNIIFDMALVPMLLDAGRGGAAARERIETMNRRFAEAVRTVGPDR